MSPDPIARRDAGLRRISGVTKGVLAAGVALTGVVSAVAAHSFAGTQMTTAAGATPASPTTASTTPAATARRESDDDNSPLQSPTYSVQPSSGSSRVSSGGS